MSVEELKEQLKIKENQVKGLKSYLLDKIYEVKSAYNFDESEYRNSGILTIYQETLNKLNELEVSE